jgi:hypothetical protein
VSTARIVRQLSFIALLLAAILNPLAHVPSAPPHAKYTVAYRISGPLVPVAATHIQLVIPNPRHHSFSTQNFLLTAPQITTATVGEAHTDSNFDGKPASASTDRLTRFQLPPPLLQA